MAIISGNGVLDGTSSNDTITGGTGADALIGEGGSDTLNGGSGDDVLNPEEYDSFWGDYDYWSISYYGYATDDGYADYVNGGAGYDKVVFRFDYKTTGISADLSNSTVSRNLAGSTVINVEEFQLVLGSGSDAITLGLGNDLVKAGAGNDTINGGAGYDQLYGDGGNDVLSSGGGGGYLYGGDGDDRLVAGSGEDWIDGEVGQDTLVLSGNQSDYQLGAYNSYVKLTNLLSGEIDYIDSLEIITFADGSVTAADVYTFTLTGTAGNDGISGTYVNDTIDGGEGNDSLYAGEGDDVVNGGAGNDSLSGDDGDDLLNGGDGDDTLFGGSGTNILDGGDGFDFATLNFSLSGTGANFTLTDGMVVTSYGTDTLLNIEAVRITGSGYADSFTGGSAADEISGGNGGDTLNGGDGDDRLDGDAGDDLLNGGAGNDALAGGDGNDALAGGDGDDTLDGGAGDETLDGGAGIDTVYLQFYASVSGVTYTLSNGAIATSTGVKTLVDIEAASISGSQYGDSLTGGAAADYLLGYDGNDMLDGAAGDDQLYGDFGDDTLNGGDGNDGLDGGQGNDTVYGGAGDDTIYSGYGNDILDGGEGIDRTTLEFYSTGFSGVTYALNGGAITTSNGIKTLSNFEGADIYASNYVDVLTGGSATDRLWGRNGNDTLNGADGDDLLYGESGNDTLNGGAGDDWLDGGQGTDIIDGGDGIDRTSLTFSSSGVGVTYTLGDGSVSTSQGVKTLTSIEGANITGSGYDDLLTGGSANDYIVGNQGNNTLSGLGGDDTLIANQGGVQRLSGGAGNDVLTGNATSTTALYSGNFADYTLTVDGTSLVVADQRSGTSDGTDELTGVGTLKFLDGTYNVTSGTFTADTLVLGDRIFIDANNNGYLDGGETGPIGVALSLFVDTDGDNVADGAAIATTVSDGSGYYSFSGFDPGNYIVQVDASNFTSGGALEGYGSIAGANDPDDNVDNDDNGLDSAVAGAIQSRTITLAYGTEPTADGAGGLNINNTLDFGFVANNEAPTVITPTPFLGRDGSEILVNTATQNSQNDPQMTTLADGKFVIIWTDQSSGVGGATGDTDSYAIKGQLFNADGTKSGGEFLVNSYTTGEQWFPQVIALPGGGFVVGIDSGNGLTRDVRAQVYDSDGAPVGSEILVNTTTTGAQLLWDMVALDGGGFVVSWDDYFLAGGDTSASSVRAQIFTDAGARVGGELLLNTTTANGQSQADITALPGGGFVATWLDGSGITDGNYNASSQYDIRAQIYAGNGTKVGGEFVVNTTTARLQQQQEVVTLDNGNFVVVWEDYSDTTDTSIQDGDLRAQVFTSAGVKVGGEILVNDASGAYGAQIVALDGGGFVVTWTDTSGLDGSYYSIRAQVFADDGTAVGSEIAVNTATSFLQQTPTIAAAPDGGFVIAWADRSQGVGGASGDSSGDAIKAQRFAADGTPVGDELLVNSTTQGDQGSPVLTWLDDGGLVVAWVDSSLTGGDTSGQAIRAQLFSSASSFSATEQQSIDLKTTITLDDVDAGAGTLSATLSVDYGILDVTAGTSGAIVSGSGTSTVTITGTLAQIQALLGTDATSAVTFTPDTDAPPASAGLTVSVDDGGNTGPGGAQVGTATQAIDITAVNDAPVNSVPATQTIGEDAALVFSGSNGNSISVSDADAYLTSPITVTLSVAHGSLTMGSLTGLTFSVGDGSGDSSMTFTGVLTDINDCLEGLTYTPSQDFDDSDILTITTNDNGNTGADPGLTGGATNEEDSDQVAITVNPVNDAPVLTTASSFGAVEQEPAAFLAAASVSDVDLDSKNGGNGDYAGASLTISRDPASAANDSFTIENGTHFTVVGNNLTTGGQTFGTISTNSNGVLVIDFTSIQAIATSALVDEVIQAIRYTNSSDNPPASVELAIGFDDGSATADVNLMTVNIAAVNDAPAGADTSVAIDEDGSRAFTAADFGFTDTDGNSFNGVVIVTTPTNGTLLLNGVAITGVNTVVSAIDIAGGNLVFVPDSGEFGDDYATFTFKVRDDGSTANGGADTDPNADTMTVDVTHVPIEGGGDDDSLTGTPFADVLNGYAGNDLINGLAGDDSIDGGDGNDTASYADATSGVSVSLLVSGAQNTLGDGTDTLTGIENLTGSAFNDTLTGNIETNVLTGGSGNDVLDGRGGPDAMIGGTGHDLYYVDNSDDVIVEAAGEGQDRILAKADFTLEAGVEIEILGAVNQISTAALNFTGNEFGQSIVGNAGDNILIGGGGNDDLNGLGGLNTMIGGTGDDIYRVRSGDVLIETAGEGDDMIRAYTSYTLASGVSVETIATKNGNSTQALDLTGNEFNQTMIGNNGINTLSGMDGNDSLLGLEGNDILIGGSGADSLRGGPGNDTFKYADVTDSMTGSIDRILDFATGDTIDLTQIDANSGAADDQAFAFVGTNAFTGTAGELRYAIIGPDTYVYGDSDGDGSADLVIMLAGSHVMTGTDFAL